MKDCKVLVIHDDQDVREVLSDLLAEKGYPVAQAADGHAALAKMRSGYRPDVILSNLLTPVMDGYQLRRELQRHHHWSSIPLLILASGEVAEDALAGIDTLLQSPIDLAELLDRVGRACRRTADG